jgi:hypothetical protein
MPIIIAGEQFAGPYRSPAMLEQRAGVYLILRIDTGRNEVLQVGEAARISQVLSGLQEELAASDGNGEAVLAYAARYTDSLSSARRRELAENLRRQLFPKRDGDAD